MASLDLEGRNLGERHRSFNAVVNKTVVSKQPLDLTLIEDEDLSNLVKIEVAAATRNVDFILEVLKGEDMLYVSRAFNRSTWLITDNRYAHIINPKYLYNELLPHMTARAFNKLLLNIRLQLKDETRVEEFYNYVSIKDPKVAYKWLQHCSVPFVVKEVRENHKDIPDYFLERLTKRSFSIFEEAVKHHRSKRHLLKNTDKLLDFLEKTKCYFKFSPKLTKYIIKTYPERILTQLNLFINIVDGITFVKYIKDNETYRKKWLPRISRQNQIFERSNIKHWIHFFPEENRFDLMTKYLVNKEKPEKGKGHDILLHLCIEYNRYQDRDTIYEIYKYAPFEIAFENIKKLIDAESDPSKRKSMLEVVLFTTRQDTKNICALLRYYTKKHNNEPYTIEFINSVVSQTDTYTFDVETWEVLNKLFHSVADVDKSENNMQEFIQATIVRNIIRGADIPDVIKSKFSFNTMKMYAKRLKSEEDKGALFNYLHNYLNNDIGGNQLNSDTFSKYLANLQDLLNLLEDWKKSIVDYPSILSKIAEVIKFNKVNNNVADLSSLYRKNKEWRKVLFEESLSLDPCDRVSVNVLKHDANSLLRHKDQIMWMISNDKISINQLLKKIRIYWPNTLAKEIKASYLSIIDSNQNVNKAVVTGIFLLLSQTEIKLFLEKYAPTEDKAENHLNGLHKYIGKRVYMARPLVPINNLLPYAKGSHLQSTIPSLFGILHQLSARKIKQYMPEIVNAPNCVQKVSIRLSFQKLSIEDLTPICNEIWNKTEAEQYTFKIRSTVRMVILTCAQKRLCQESNETQIRKVFDLMSKWLNEATCGRDKLILKLADVSQIPFTIKPEYFMLVYKFLLTYGLYSNRRFRPPIKKMGHIALNMMELLEEDLVFSVILGNMDIQRRFPGFTSLDYHIFAALILQSNDEDVQIRRYEKFVVPLIKKTTLPLKWAVYFVNSSTRNMLRELIKRFKDITIYKGKHIPVKVFQSIQSQLEEDLGYERGYTTVTYWKLAAELVRLIDVNKNVLNAYYEEEKEKGYGNIWSHMRNMYQVIGPTFGKFCAELVISDLNKFYPSVYTLFTIALKEFMDDFLGGDRSSTLTFYKFILECGNEKELHLAIYPLISSEIPCTPEGKIVKEIMVMIFPNLTPELRMHYYQKFNGEP